jgi:type II secretory pathway component GspD/PulD (secretin)
VVDERTRSLVMRGTEKDVQTAAELVALAELPREKPLPALKHLKAFRLKHADAAQTAELLTELGVEARVVALVPTNVVVASGPEAAMKEVAEVLQALDVEVKEPPPPKNGAQE